MAGPNFKKIFQSTLNLTCTLKIIFVFVNQNEPYDNIICDQINQYKL
jgi:hypothetical protein